MVLGIVLAVSALIIAHELGHWAVARLCGIKVEAFSIGFGPQMAAWPVGPDRVRCAVKLIPLGGFVQLADERSGPMSAARAFNRASLGKRIAVLGAGPAVNFTLGVLILALFLWHGAPVSLRPIVGQVALGSLASHAGIERGDRIVSVGPLAVNAPEAARLGILSALQARASVRLGLERQGHPRHVVLDPGISSAKTEGLARLGFHLEGAWAGTGVAYGPAAAFGRAIAMSWELSVLEAQALWHTLTMRSSIGAFANSTWVSAMSGGGNGSALAFLAELSITLALVNLLPVPMLDGGRILYELAQRLRRVSEAHSDSSGPKRRQVK
jgi:regulator of sigma E protease